MSQNPQLDSYLSRLDRALGPIPVGDRSDIITEIKSHILEAQSKDSARPLHEILQSIGEPESVANRYLMERGLKPGKPTKTPMVKWLTVGFLGTFGMILLFALIIMFKFSPLVKISDSENRIQILGGLIDIDGDDSHISVKDTGSSSFHGFRLLHAGADLNLPFKNGKFTLSNSTDGKFHWDCKTSPAMTDSDILEGQKELKFNMESRSAKCEFEIPADIHVKLIGDNGKIEIEKPHFHLNVAAHNGKVSFHPESATPYAYDVKLHNGVTDSFESSKDPRAFHVQVDLYNGKFSRE